MALLFELVRRVEPDTQDDGTSATARRRIRAGRIGTGPRVYTDASHLHGLKSESPSVEPGEMVSARRFQRLAREIGACA